MNKAAPAVMDARRFLDDLLACPACGQSLGSDAARYSCAGCGRSFPVTDGIPRFIGDLSDDVQQIRRSFHLEHSKYLESRHVHFGPRLAEQWLEDVQLPREYFKGKLVLDAGCGSGRWTYALASLGATVVAVDLTDSGVEVTRKATEALDQVAVLQADIFRLPFKPGSFDFVVSWGVLHHTPDTSAAFAQLAPLVKKGGELFVMIYERRNPPKIFCTNVVRWLLQRFPEEQRYRLCRSFIIRNPVLYHLLRPFILCMRPPKNGDPLELSTMQFGLFDWYSPKFNHLHTYPEVRRWFHEFKFDRVILTKPVLYSRWWEVLRYGECGGNIYMRGTRA
jgi:2-polyprenyl-3-methyl-5-hydroxy-6-metoxy-1,4-benzoquinol methylase